MKDAILNELVRSRRIRENGLNREESQYAERTVVGKQIEGITWECMQIVIPREETKPVDVHSEPDEKLDDVRVKREKCNNLNRC